MPLQDRRLNSFQPDFSGLLGVGFANPHHVAAFGHGGFLIEDKFHHLTAAKVETSTQPETFF